MGQCLTKRNRLDERETSNSIIINNIIQELSDTSSDISEELDNEIENSELPECSICLLKIKDNKIYKIKNCQHSFHKKCINKWKKTSNECPLCRGPIVSELRHTTKQAIQNFINLRTRELLEDYLDGNREIIEAANIIEREQQIINFNEFNRNRYNQVIMNRIINNNNIDNNLRRNHDQEELRNI